MTPTSLGALRSLSLVGAFGVFGCGPNVQLIYESNVRFEHCYRLDLDPGIAPTHRKACWRDYLARHTYAQTGDRVTYARQRLGELDRGQKPFLTLNLDGGTALTGGEAVPLPSTIHAAPPPRAPDPPPLAPIQPPPPKKLAPPYETECSDACVSGWSDCAGSCLAEPDTTAAGGAAPKSSSVPTSPKHQKDACSACKKTFKTCMHQCYR